MLMKLLYDISILFTLKISYIQLLSLLLEQRTWIWPFTSFLVKYELRFIRQEQCETKSGAASRQNRDILWNNMY